jgi:hypothetical protein
VSFGDVTFILGVHFQATPPTERLDSAPAEEGRVGEAEGGAEDLRKGSV